MNVFGFNFGLRADPKDTELPSIFAFHYQETRFVYADVVNIYTRILTDVLERTEGFAEKYQHTLWDNCLASETQDGLITLLAKAMTDKSELFLVYDKATEVLKRANQTEAAQIKKDYESNGKSSAGVYVTFKNNNRTDMIKIYSGFEYCTVASLWKSMNLSKALQVKVSDLRASVALVDSDVARNQGVAIATALSKGQDVMMDAKDVIETATPDLTAAKASMEFIDNKRSLYLGLPTSYITGILNGGMGDTGKSDSKAVERGLKPYYFSIIKPILKALFDSITTFKSEDFDQVDAALEALKTFDLTSNDHLSSKNKTSIASKLFGLPADSKGDPPVKEVTPPPVAIPASKPVVTPPV